MGNSTTLQGVYKYRHLPLLSKFILEKHLHEFSTEQLKYAREYDIPLLKYLSHFSDEQLLEISKDSLTEIFSYLIDNNTAEYINLSTRRWLSNQLEIVGKYDIAAEDITLISHVRGKSLKNFAFKFYKDNPNLQELLAEIDDFHLASNTISTNTYIDILKDQLHEEAEFRSKLSSALPGFIYVYDVQNNRQIFSNDKLNDILGYTDDEIKERSINFYQSITHPDDWHKLFECRKTYKASDNTTCSFECRVKSADGNYKWIRYYETVLKADEKGNVSEIIGVAFDISSEKLISEALATREEQLLEAQSIAHIGSFEWYINSNRSASNTPETYKVFEMEEMEEFAQFRQYVHRDDLKKMDDALKQSFETGNYECVYRYLRNGKEKTIWSKGVVTIENKIPVKMIGTVQDISAIRSIEAQLEQKTAELQKSNESLQQFAAIASHDLKEPLRKISIFASRVLNDEKDKLSELSYASLNKVFDSTGRMQRMINDILKFSFLDAEDEKAETDLEELLCEVKEVLSEAISNKHAEIISDGLPRAIVIAPQMRQLFQNLISNARKFCAEGQKPKITITHKIIIDNPAAAAVNKQLEISVTDNGIGFDNSSKEQIFDLFYRLHGKSKFEGSGLGLSICRKIAEKHGGSISAESKSGEGATFKILLPQK